MILIDTSVWVEVLRDKSLAKSTRLKKWLGQAIYFLCRFTQLELLQGAKNEEEWQQLNDYLSTQLYVDMEDESWTRAARIYFDLIKKGITVRSPIDCCIAQLCLENQLILLHKDRDFKNISKVRPLVEEWFH